MILSKGFCLGILSKESSFEGLCPWEGCPDTSVPEVVWSVINTLTKDSELSLFLFFFRFLTIHRNVKGRLLKEIGSMSSNSKGRKAQSACQNNLNA